MKLARLLIALVVVTAASPGIGAALENVRGAARWDALPDGVRPVRYTIDLRPDLSRLTTAGTETIDIDVRQPTDNLIFNANNVVIDSAVLDEDIAAQFSLESRIQRVKLTFPHPIRVGPHRLRLSFTSKINEFAQGLFHVDYSSGDGRKRMIATQLEPMDARRVFPCWDEPAFKAAFHLSVALPEKFNAVSNMPIEKEVPLGDGLKRTTFDETPPMSSYLFVLVAGELGRIVDHSGKTEIGVVAQPDKLSQGRYSLSNAVALLDYYNQYFGVAYPLPKLDLIAVPGGFGGAMENWGGITFFEGILLFDSASSSESTRRRIFSVVAHEMAHQWFGDLVTTAWWSDLWLNEGFADWMQAKVEDHLHPDWNVWLSEYGKQGAMYADARPMSHAIQHPVSNESEASFAFDEITYEKGAAVVRMLENYVGADAFREGIRRYIKAHAYANATTQDLWRALDTPSANGVDAIARSYTEQPGLPLITVNEKCQDGQLSIALKQERFTIHYPDATPGLWQVPINWGVAHGSRPAGSMLLRDQRSDVAAGPCGAPIKLNLGDVGYYRTRYDPGTLASLTSMLEQMAPVDRLNLLSDYWALLEAGRASAADYFGLVEQVGRDDQRAIWREVASVLLDIDRLERGLPGRLAFQAYARGVLRPVLQRVGWGPVPNEKEDTAMLRSTLVAALGSLDDPGVVAEAKRRFDRFLADPASLNVNLRDAVLVVAGRHADQATYNAIRKLAHDTTNAHDRVQYYAALAGATDPRLIEQTLAMTLTDELQPERASGLIRIVAAGEHPELALEFATRNFDALAAKRGPDFRSFFMSELMANFEQASYSKQLADFRPVHETSGGRMEALRAEARINESADFRAHQVPQIDEWIKDRQRAAQPNQPS